MQTVAGNSKRQGTGQSEGTDARDIDHQLRHQGISRTKRHLPPAHYALKVQSYSLWCKTEQYESDVFEAGGYKWRLAFYPNGDKDINVENYVSLYLEIVETGSLPSRWEVNVNFKLFLHDQLEDQYLTIQDAYGDVKRFHEMKTKWGFSHFVSHRTLKDPSNGYLINDTCVFGAEVLVIKRTGNWESLSLVKAPKINSNATFTWKIENFSKLEKEFYESEVFIVGGKKWNLKIYPNGTQEYYNKGISLPLFLMKKDWGNHPVKAAVYVEYKLRLLDQVNGKHLELAASYTFRTAEEFTGYGSPNLISLEDLRKPNGFIVKDSLIVEVEFLVVSQTRRFSENVN